ncbi:hypothetical protein CLRAG_12500 [Clostridium ragsdalei P11]|uniref:Lipoprotein n=2 Tax=Clostridiaceae TaxID=31979 RepID=A0A1A6AXY1_9CLOT|nr:hypothetical protein CLRAG_12500 [Clostridium ragsdalei P11]
MFCYGKRKVKKGFILIYVLFIGCMCILISLGCYSMEMHIRSNNLNSHKKSIQVDVTEKYREYLFTELNEYISKNPSCDDNGIKQYISSLDNFKIYFEECYIFYDKNMDCFKVEYIFNGEFYKEETYEYEVKNKDILYSCIDYSFKKGGLEK